MLPANKSDETSTNCSSVSSVKSDDVKIEEIPPKSSPGLVESSNLPACLKRELRNSDVACSPFLMNLLGLGSQCWIAMQHQFPEDVRSWVPRNPPLKPIVEHPKSPENVRICKQEEPETLVPLGSPSQIIVKSRREKQKTEKEREKDKEKTMKTLPTKNLIKNFLVRMTSMILSDSFPQLKQICDRYYIKVEEFKQFVKENQVKGGYSFDSLRAVLKSDPTNKIESDVLTPRFRDAYRICLKIYLKRYAIIKTHQSRAKTSRTPMIGAVHHLLRSVDKIDSLTYHRLLISKYSVEICQEREREDRSSPDSKGQMA